MAFETRKNICQIQKMDRDEGYTVLQQPRKTIAVSP